MAPPSVEIIDISSDEEDDNSIKRCVKKERNTPIVSRDFDFDDECVILDDDPDKSLRFEKNQSGNGESDELLIVAEKGQVACRDYPHARHLCARFPFNTNPHNKYCDMCHCYVCDTHAPCVYWGSGDSRDDHCHSTDKEEIWRLLRECSKEGTLKRVYESTRHPNTISCAVPTHPEQACSQPQTINENSVVLSDLGKLSGTVKWFNRTRGYGFIIPDNGEEELFVHQSSIKAEGFWNLAEREAVEFDVGNGEDGRKMAINVTGPGGSFVRGTTITTVSSSVISARNGLYNCREGRHFARNCSYTGSSSSGPEPSDTNECADLENELASAEKLTGIVKWYNKQRGFGTITPDNGGREIFVKKSSINKGYRTLTEGELVEFQIGSGEDGRRMAINVGEVTKCHSCGGKGHLATNCPQKVCHKCNERGHLEKDCNEKVCYRCDENGHFGSECPQFVCNKCGEQGHYYIECTQKVSDECHENGHLGSDCSQRRCWRCSKTGHWGIECPQFVCNKCNEQGHLSRYCTERWCRRCKQKEHTDKNCPRIVCYKCKGPGHLARDCTGKVCHRCNEKGHTDNNCPSIVCNKCKEPGHFARDCTGKVCHRCGEKRFSDEDCPQNVCYACDFAQFWANVRF